VRTHLILPASFTDLLCQVWPRRRGALWPARIGMRDKDSLTRLTKISKAVIKCSRHSRRVTVIDLPHKSLHIKYKSFCGSPDTFLHVSRSPSAGGPRSWISDGGQRDRERDRERGGEKRPCHQVLLTPYWPDLPWEVQNLNYICLHHTSHSRLSQCLSDARLTGDVPLALILLWLQSAKDWSNTCTPPNSDPWTKCCLNILLCP